ncbi:MAG TPA: 4a-hydroxytetrahydrobiopterin dehydratase [Candidatus Dormibacteraeota bacterium]|nr:4a-hydroxytetrahydrobiopterin dehydratase [Candidatus Dormibacteraeota bacterium]
MPLADERCEACTGATPRLGAAEVATMQGDIDPAWEVVDGVRLRRRLRYPDFASAFAAAAHVGLLAEAQGHHPDLTVGWGRLVVEITTHAIGGLSRNDFILAAHVDRALHAGGV